MKYPIYDKIFLEKIQVDELPKCEDCKNGIVKPDIIFSGEKQSNRFHTLYPNDFSQAELLIIMGSRLDVYPFSSLIDKYVYHITAYNYKLINSIK
jgi:NAD-dependent SIR2 family protein deacetylase